ncbi:MAG: hypothetical protein LDLANPLL_02685 [Turneriella sp.]|nr:hypothetical protein [Turneriella sp.]
MLFLGVVSLNFFACKKEGTAQTKAPQIQKMYVRTEPSTTLREDANETGNILMQIPFGSSVEVIPANDTGAEHDEKKHTWLKATFNNKTGFVSTTALSLLPLPQAGCRTVLDYARKQLTPEGAETRRYDNPAKKGPYHWKQKFKEGVTVEGYGSIDTGAMVANLPFHDSEIAFEICKRCTPFFKSLTYASFKEQNEVIQECGGRTKQGGCLIIWSIETVHTKSGVRLKCGSESM